MDTNTERALTLRLPSHLHDELKRRAVEEDRSIAQVIRVAARYYLSTPPPMQLYTSPPATHV